jgi:hypothetical protein
MHPPNTPQPLIFEHQSRAFDKLLSAGRVCFSPLRKHLPVQPRTNSLIVGPTGTGKTYLADAVAKFLGVPCKHLSIAEWMLLGTSCRGAQRTWTAIFEFLASSRNGKGAMVFIDEIDKLTGTSDWCQHLRVEVFRFLDREVPPDLSDSDNDNYPSVLLASVSDFLKHKTLIVAAGAFQHLWDNLGNRVGGFAGEIAPEVPSAAQLAGHLARELVNRFRSDIVLLPDLAARDYENILLAAAAKMPAPMQERFLSLGAERISAAHANRQGVRFLEELVADVLGEEEAAQRVLPPSLWKTHPLTTPGAGT